MNDLMKPAFIIGYTALLAIIIGLFYFGDDKNITTGIITLLTNVITGAVTYYYTKERMDK